MTKQRVAIIGGGPSGLSTAFALSDPSLAERFDVTVYQLGWRAGGHCSSGRVPPNWWVDQNGTHYLFGCYAEAIDLGALGGVTIRRASHVEPDQEGRWWADLGPVGGPRLGPFGVRSAALAAEVQWLETALVGRSHALT